MLYICNVNYLNVLIYLYTRWYVILSWITEKENISSCAQVCCIVCSCVRNMYSIHMITRGSRRELDPEPGTERWCQNFGSQSPNRGSAAAFSEYRCARVGRIDDEMGGGNDGQPVPRFSVSRGRQWRKPNTREKTEEPPVKNREHNINRDA